MRNYWKRFEAWATALRRKLFLSAGIKLTALYILNAVIILGVFAIASSYFQFQYLQKELTGLFVPGVNDALIIQDLYNGLRNTTALLIVLVLVAIGILSYFMVRQTLRPLRNFVETQRRFISDASHELRTPLALMKTENEVALMDTDKLTREEAISVLNSNVEEVDHISTILNNLLSLASFTNAAGDPPLRAVNLAEVAKSVLAQLKISATHKKVRLSAPNIPPLSVWGNPTALEEVLSNLIKNAIQYTQPGGEVALRIRPRPKEKEAEIVVQDTGIGIVPEDLPYIFEPFYRSDKTLHMYQQGSGLGLPLVHQIVSRHNGSIDIQSAPGKGTVVTVLLPMAPSSEAPAGAEKTKEAEG